MHFRAGCRSRPRSRAGRDGTSRPGAPRPLGRLVGAARAARLRDPRGGRQAAEDAAYRYSTAAGGPRPVRDHPRCRPGDRAARVDASWRCAGRRPTAACCTASLVVLAAASTSSTRVVVRLQRPRPRAGPRRRTNWDSSRGDTLRRQLRRLRGRCPRRRGADVPRARLLPARAARRARRNRLGRPRVRARPRAAGGTADARHLRRRPGLACASARTASIRGWSSTRPSTRSR